jgi:prepilin-type N-terminal cleavage/methylation domain-containing protein
LLRFFVNQKRRTAEGGFTLIELVVVLAILGILLALAVPRYLGARKRAYKAEIDNILQEAKTLSWAYYQEYNTFSGITVSAIGLSMPVGAAWNTPSPSVSGGTITWTASGQASGFPVTTSDTCSVVLTDTGDSSQGCNF